ncbi:hypothetical protein thsps21_52460 [Pseudomonas sp. No.21]|uniref:hypothetical protein n=1 Tax=Pseudomonas TaxID=286 RepID=UPI000DA9CE96|nr:MULTISPECIES: hypothetical protein [Pseudomonas]MDW3714464.1 hypothetical protein [Pseudomonas sp. 2023EL-01195]PZE14475.1 hypothetical protein DMX10_05765 [Pseudomonas sp. 57B-090624]GJN48534.1 hypothetical protein TUM20249_45200 [Pseudomonas tohonis]
MRRLAAFIAAALISTPLWAMHCPQDMAKIDEMLKTDPPSDTALLAEVQRLRAEGEELHKAGNHEESARVLKEAIDMLQASE